MGLGSGGGGGGGGGNISILNSPSLSVCNPVIEKLCYVTYVDDVEPLYTVILVVFTISQLYL